MSELTITFTQTGEKKCEKSADTRSRSCLKTLKELHRLCSCVCVCVCVCLILHHMLGDRVRIGEEKRKINDLRSECIAAFTH